MRSQSAAIPEEHHTCSILLPIVSSSKSEVAAASAVSSSVGAYMIDHRAPLCTIRFKHVHYPQDHAPNRNARLTKKLPHPIKVVADALELVLDLLLSLHRLRSIAGGRRLLG